MNRSPLTIRKKNMKKRMPFLAKALALTLAFTILFQAVEPTVSYALTSGPTQPEAAQFQPVGVTDMVDVFTGDFGYNIPLLELPGPNGGYPFNLSYQSGITLDQEASWVGLGWNVNPGAIVRNMRGLPDEFNGKSDQVERVMDMKPNETYGAKTAISLELAGADASIGSSLSIGVNIYENSYRGIGYGFDLGTSFGDEMKNGANVGVGFNLSLDSQEGVGANVNASITSKGHEDKLGRAQKESLGLGIGFHSSGGLNGSISGSISAYKKVSYNGKDRKIGNGISGSSFISFANPSHTPSIGMEMKSMNFTGHLSIGPGYNTVFPTSSVDGYYSLSKVAKAREELPAYGYLNLQNQKEDYAMADFNREKDGVLYRKSKNLASPSLTYDYYVINGQGVGGMFRPYRQEYGHVHEQGRSSEGAGGTFGLDVGIPGHYGINGSFNYSRSRTGDWEEGNDAHEWFQFRGKHYRNSAADNYDGHTYEGAYFKIAGEKAAIPLNELNDILGEKPAALLNYGHNLSDVLWSDGAYPPFPSPGLEGNHMRRDKRMPRAVAIVAYTNDQLLDRVMHTTGSGSDLGEELLGEYNIQVYLKSEIPGATITAHSLPPLGDYQTKISRARGVDSDEKMVNGNHLAGHTIVQPDGKRYVYGLPAYNNTQVQETFSVTKTAGNESTIPYSVSGNYPTYQHGEETDEYHERVTLPRYPHSYLLTAVLGDDYVDADKVPGPSQGDYGYWVKFNYIQTSAGYKWRSPLSGASYIPGSDGSSVDDKGSYTYGEKEIWYLASAETQTHILYFEMSPRGDGLGVALEGTLDPNAPALDAGNKLYKLDRIKLYSKAEHLADSLDEPLQTVHFEYNYHLCQGTANSMAGDKGKLTLKKVYFTHKNDRSGMLSPYVFNYEGANPNYDMLHNRYDRWGTYRSFNYGNDRVNQEFPYTPQFDPGLEQNQTQRNAFRAQTDQNASAWHLTSVQLPSGGKIKVEYESDDYAYVQHKKATQMFRFASVGAPPGSNPANRLFDDEDNFWGTGYNPENDSDVVHSLEARKIYFRLEKPIQSVYSPEQAREQIIEQYMDCLLDKEAETYTKPLYAKMKVNLRGTINDYISGYFFAQLDDVGKPLCGVVDNPVTIDGMSSYEYGYLVLDFAKVEGQKVYYHPIAVAAWQYMRINLPRVLTGVGEFVSGENNQDMEHLTRMASLGSWINTIQSMFTGYRKYCFEKEFAQTLTLNESFIRLSSPDGIKYGGGSRVKKLYVEDDPIWGDDKIGQVYDYTRLTGRGGAVISSGVASYEPIIGGEENVLRSAKIYTQDIPFFTDNNLFFELPVNESYYPAPRVGYSKVTVTSLATHEVQQKIAQSASPDTYMGILTTGQTVHEFYTAREFPVIAKETDLQPFGQPTLVPLPFVGMVQVSKLTASQGYSIELNDMHGKPKSVATYASKKEGGFTEDPITRVQYNYLTEPISHEGEPAYRLVNKVHVLQDDPQMLGNAYIPSSSASNKHQAITEEMYVGLEYDFFADFRKAVDEAGTGGLSFNMDIIEGGIVKLPFPFPWPSFNFSHTSTRMAVTNKIINRSGILNEVVATDGQSTVRTRNLVFDKYTGEPLVTTVNNNHDNQIFNYEYPAHLAYEGTGAAYDNVLLEFTGNLKPLPGGRGWTLEREDETGMTTVYKIGMGEQVGRILPYVVSSGSPYLPNYISYDDLYDLLAEGDEFIVEFVKKEDSNVDLYYPNAKTVATLIERRIGASYVGCEDEKQLIFDFHESLITRGNPPVRLLLVRSGKRNLLNLKTGAIKTLMEPGATGSLLSNSPLERREKETALSGVQPTLYEGLTRQTADFLNGILDCEGQFPVGTYYLDDARFLTNEGALKYPELFGLLKSIDVFDNCGGNYCHDPGTAIIPPHYYVICKPGCGEPPADAYDNPPCDPALPSSGVISSFVAAGEGAGLTRQQILDLWNGSHSCHQLLYDEGGSRLSCDAPYCETCSGRLAVAPDGTNIYRGYHLILRFRDEFVPYANNQPCLTAHCTAKSKFINGSGDVSRTYINKVTYETPGNIKIHYATDGSSEPGNVSDFCLESYSFQIPSTYYNIKNVLAASAVELTPYKLNEEMYKIKTCTWDEALNKTVTTYEAPRNLYRFGFKGIWRAAKTYYYADERFQGTKPQDTDHMTAMLDLATDGVFDGDMKDDSPDKKFYLFNWNSFLAKKIYPKWLANETVTAFTRNSQSAEARDVLGLYSAVKFDKNGYLPVAVGRNMRANKMIYENFDNTQEVAWLPTDNFDSGENSIPDTAQVEKLPMPFTGNYSLSIKGSVRYIFPRTQFAPDPGEKYIISMWAGGYNTLYSPEQIAEDFFGVMDVVVFFIDENSVVVGTPTVVRGKGKIMEGKAGFWRRMEETVTVPPGTHRMALWFNSGAQYTYPGGQYGTMYQTLSPNGSVFLDQRACYDDIRIYPEKGLMQTYVYDTQNYRLVAEGDENNFPTFYGYAPSGALMVVKKLTEEGIKTLKEIRANTKRGPYTEPYTNPDIPQGEDE